MPLDIAELARRSGIPAPTLRLYERKGLIASTGRRGTRRTFDAQVLQQLALIAFGQAAGLSLAELRELRAPDGALRIDRDRLAAKADKLDGLIRRLVAMRETTPPMGDAPALDHPEFADFYDEAPLWSAPFAQKILERAPLKRGQAILDLGCGTGFLSLELAQRCGRDSRVWAIDPWDAAMDRLARKLAYHRVENVELVRRDAADTALPSGFADLAVSNLGINNFEDPGAVLKETRRLLKPGGRLLMTTNLTGHMAEIYAGLRDVMQDQPTGLQALAVHEARRGTVETVTGRLEEAGFRCVDHETSAFAMRFADGAALLDHWFIRMAFAPAWLAICGADGLRGLAERLDGRARENGGLALTIPVAVFEAVRP